MRVQSSEDGEGNFFCETCGNAPCTAVVTMYFDDLAEGGWCVTYDEGSGAPTSSEPVIRTFILETGCDEYEPSEVNIEIVTCSSGAAEYSASVTLYCPCIS
jgi:hypothetical protein